MSTSPVRVLVAKPGLDGHDRGAKVVARGLRDAGFEVIYTGLHQTPEMVVTAAMQEDVDIVGLSILSGAHVPLVKAIHKLMKDQKLNKPIFVGGIIPDDDAQLLIKSGVAAVFGPGTSMSAIVEGIQKILSPRKSVSKKLALKKSAVKKALLKKTK
ncbi:MAG: cobalamin B12-binding domain-containing protein [Bdellovibrionales bacterium]